MAQWQELLKLDPALQSRVSLLYQGKFPREIRHCLSVWIESQDWDLAASDENTATTCFQALVIKLDELRNESIHNNNILLGPDYSSMKDFLLNHFESQPLAMAVILSECLKEETAILASCLVEQCCSLEEQKQKDLDNKVRALKKQTWETEREIKSLEVLNEKLEFIQRTWESQVEQMNGLSRSREVVQQACLNQASFITQTKQVVVDQIVKSVNLAAVIVNTLITVELPEWKRRQQLACLGSPVSTSLDRLQMWFTAVGESLLQIHQQLKKLLDQSSKHHVTDVSNLPEVIEQIDTFTKSLLKKLLENALVIEKQPVMWSLTHRPLILKIRVRFTVTIRFLVNLPMFKCQLNVRPVFDKDVEEVKTIKGFRQFVFIASDSKVLDVYTPEGGLVAEFGHMSIKEGKEGSKSRVKGSTENPIGVTEELHIIKFVTKLQLAGLECDIETSSLPLVVVTSSSQVPSAWATVMWCNLLSTSEPRNLSLFVEPPPLSWEHLSQALSWQFLSTGDRELDENQLSELKGKIVEDPNDLVYWYKFSKNDWIWIDGILDLIQKHLKCIWRDGLVMGFVNKEKTRLLLQNKQSGNFLLRFSESYREGAITFSWVEHSNGEVNVHAVEPYTRRELSAMSLPDIIYHYSLRAQQMKMTNPLVYLYPDIPKDIVFGRYYTEAGISAPKNKDGYVNRKLISVTDCSTPPPSPPTESVMEVETDLAQVQQSVSSEELLQELFPGVLDSNSSPANFMQMLLSPTDPDISCNITL